MMVGCASYPKSGNTWIRAIIVSLLYSEDGIFNFNMLKKMIYIFTKHNYVNDKKNISAVYIFLHKC